MRRLAGAGLVRRSVVVALQASASVLAATPLAAAAPSIEVVDATAKGIEIRVPDAKVDQLVHVVAMNDEATGPLRIDPHSLKDAAGTDLAVTIEADPATCPPTIEKACALRIKATLPAPGVYTTDLDIVYSKTRLLRRVTLTYPAAAPKAPEAPGVEVLGLTTVQKTKRVPSFLSWVCDAWPSKDAWCAEAAVVPVALRDTDDASETLLAKDASMALSRKASGGRDVPVDFPTLLVSKDGAEVPELVLPAGGNGVQSARFTIGGLVQPGVHSAQIRLPVRGKKPLDVTCTVVFREHWLWASLPIVLGVLGSHLLRRYLGVGRQRLVWLGAVRGLIAGLDEHLRAPEVLLPERAVGKRVRVQLEALLGDLSWNARKDSIEARIELMGAKIGLFDDWLTGRRDAEKLLLPADRDKLVAELDKAELRLGDSLATKVAIDEQRRALLEAAAKQGRRRALREGIDALAATIEKQKKVASGAKRALGDIEQGALRAARRALDDDRLDDAERELESATSTCAKALSAALEGTLDRVRPPTFDDAKWQELVGEVREHVTLAREATSAGEAIAEHEKAQRTLVRALAGHLASEAKRQRDALGDEDPDPQKKKVAKDLDEIQSSARQAEKQATSGDVTEAQAKCEELRPRLARLAAPEDDERYESMPTTDKKRGSDVTDAAVTGWVPALLRLPLLFHSAASLSTPESIRHVVESRDELVTFCLGVIAVVSGLQALWIPSEAWGGLDAYVVAFLWGFGLHQLGNGPFEGLLGLRERLSKIGG